MSLNIRIYNVFFRRKNVVSIRKTKKAEKKLANMAALKKQAMSLDEAYSLVDNIYKASDATINWRELDEALKIIGASDASLAAEMKKDFELREAYQIAGGYYQYGHNALQKTIDKRFQNAIKLVEADDPEFADALRHLHDMGTSFKKATPEQMSQNARDLAALSEDEELIATVCEDETVREALDNSLPENNPDEAERLVLLSATQDTIAPLTEDGNFADANAEEKRSMFAERFKKAVKWNLFKARIQSLGRSIANIKDALNFKKRVSVSWSSIADGFKHSTERFTSFIGNVAKKGYTSVAAWLNKNKTKIGSKAIKLATFSLLLSPLGCSTRENSSPAQITAPTITLNAVRPSGTVVADTIPTDSSTIASMPARQATVADTTRTTDARAANLVAAQTVTTDSATVVSADTISTTDSRAASFMADFMAAQTATTDSTAVASADTISTTNPRAASFMADFMAAQTATTDSATVASADTISTANPRAASFMADFMAAQTATTDSVATDSIQIVSDSDSIPFGTPAAGYVSERGGYENRGVGNKKQYLNLRAKIHSTWANELGENAYDVMVDHINSHPEVFRSKGCIGEGWTADQILQSYITMRGAPAGYGNELIILGRLMNPRGCNMHVTAAEMGQINDMLSHSNADNLRDGVLYEMPTRMTGVTFDQCSQPVSMTVENTNQSNITPHRTSGVKHPEYYMLPVRKPVKTEPVYTVVQDTVYTTTYVDSLVTPKITLHRGSEMDVDAPGSQNLGSADPAILRQDLTGDTKVLVETARTEGNHQGNITLHRGSEMDVDASGSQDLGSADPAILRQDLTDGTRVLTAGGSKTTTSHGKTTKAKKGGKKKTKFSYDDLTPEQRAARLEAARNLVNQWRGH